MVTPGLRLVTATPTADGLPVRIEALPGSGRYTVAFRRSDGSEQAAVVEIRTGAVEVAEASLPPGWTRGSELFEAVAAAVVAFDAARSLVPAPSLRDVDGGWDVSLGNVVLGPSGVPTCIGHGAMAPAQGAIGDGRYECAECGACAVLG